MNNVVNIVDYKERFVVGNLVKNMVNDLYNECMNNINKCDVYSYIDIDVLDMLDSNIDSNNMLINSIDGLDNLIYENVKGKNGIYHYLYDLGFLADIDVNPIDVLITVVEDGLNRRLLSDGFKVCFNFLDEEGVGVWDGESLIELDSSDVFDRLILKVIDSIPYELIYIR